MPSRRHRIEGVEKTVRITFDCPFEMSDPRVTGSGPMECDEGFYDLTDLPGGVGVWDTCSMILTGQGTAAWIRRSPSYGSAFELTRIACGRRPRMERQICEGQRASTARLRGPDRTEPGR